MMTLRITLSIKKAAAARLLLRTSAGYCRTVGPLTTEGLNPKNGLYLGAGVGLTYAFNQYLSLSADYFYTEYQPLTNAVPKYTITFRNKGQYNFIGGSLTYTT